MVLNENPDIILYEDQDIIVCHKPAGVPVQSGSLRQQDMVSLLNNHLSGTGDSCLVVHRLDQPVEGVMVFAKNKEAAANLSRQITQGSMKKIYHAVCCRIGQSEAAGRKDSGQGRPGSKDCLNQSEPPWEPDTGITYHLTDYLVRDGRTNTSRVCKKEDRNAKFSELYYKILDKKELEGRRYFLAEIELKTGRHHQIRVQMAQAGMPLYGDRKYNPAWQEYLICQDEIKGCVPALCAVSLTFRHPNTGRPMKFDTASAVCKFSYFL